MDDGHGCGQEAEIFSFVQELGVHVSIKWTGPHRWYHQPTYSHLNRERILTEQGTVIKPCARYTDTILEVLGMQGCAAVSTPMVEMTLNAEDLEDCHEKESGQYRSAVGVLLYLAQDRGDLSHTTKELSRFTKKPVLGAFTALKKMREISAGHARLRIFCSVF